MKYIFLKEQHTNEDLILVVKDEWFDQMAICETYGPNGIRVECENKDEAGNCCCETVRGHTYWDGSNHQTIVIEAENHDVPFLLIEEDDTDYQQYVDAINDMEFSHETTGHKHYTAPGFEISDSIWNGDWWLYSITERDDDDDEGIDEAAELVRIR